jgi:hypothetical protein
VFVRPVRCGVGLWGEAVDPSLDYRHQRWRMSEWDGAEQQGLGRSGLSHSLRVLGDATWAIDPVCGGRGLGALAGQRQNSPAARVWGKHRGFRPSGAMRCWPGQLGG